jgi:multidrug efflux pump
MLGVTLFGIFLTPVFYYVIQWFNDLRSASVPVPLNGVPAAVPSSVAPSAGIMAADRRNPHP